MSSSSEIVGDGTEPTHVDRVFGKGGVGAMDLGEWARGTN